jgi:radical S-adenosyl methionine domain-containing protein 2
MQANITTHTELVINWHITEACNYSCRYCYAHWCKPKQRELIHDKEQTKALLLAICDYFQPGHGSGLLSPNMKWSTIRLNIAGGEPLLYPEQALFIAKTAKKLGMNVSLISNGSRLTHELMQNLAPYLSLFGLSLDSTSEIINKGIGRVDNKANFLDLNSTQLILEFGKRTNPLMDLKLNTVVNRANYLANMTDVIASFKPKRWKILRMLPVINGNLDVSDKQFRSFIDRNSKYKHLMCVENNDDMSESYIMIDPLGRFFQNKPESSGDGYVYSIPILKTGVGMALKDINFSSKKFLNRYKSGDA